EHIESSKFEPGDFTIGEIQTMTGDAQIILLLILSLARERRDLAPAPAVETAAAELDGAVAAALQALAARASHRRETMLPRLAEPLNPFERSMAATVTVGREAAASFDARLQLYRPLVAAIERLSLEFPATDAQRDRQVLLQRREIQMNS